MQHPVGGGATIAREGYAPHYLGGNYPEGVVGTADWTHVIGTYTVPRTASVQRLALYLRRGATGKAWFDDETVEQVNPDWNVYLISPAPDFLPPAGGQLTFGCFPESEWLTPQGRVEPKDLLCRPSVRQSGREVAVLSAAPQEGRLRSRLPKLTAGVVCARRPPNGSEPSLQARWPLTTCRS